MTPKAIIDEVITVRDGTDPAKAANIPRRVQALAFLNHLNHFLHNYREWPWTWTEADVTFLTGTRTADLPTVYEEFGQHGGLWDPGLKKRYKEISFHRMARMRMELNSTNLYVFCVRGDSATPSEFIELPFNVTSDLTLHAIYRRSADIITNHDEDTVPILIPDRFCRLVVIPGLTRAMQQSKDDARPDWASELKDGLSMMCQQANPLKTTVTRWPSAIPGAW